LVEDLVVALRVGRIGLGAAEDDVRRRTVGRAAAECAAQNQPVTACHEINPCFDLSARAMSGARVVLARGACEHAQTTAVSPRSSASPLQEFLARRALDAARRSDETVLTSGRGHAPG